jgi:hypothetical protein
MPQKKYLVTFDNDECEPLEHLLPRAILTAYLCTEGPRCDALRADPTSLSAPCHRRRARRPRRWAAPCGGFHWAPLPAMARVRPVPAPRPYREARGWTLTRLADGGHEQGLSDPPRSGPTMLDARGCWGLNGPRATHGLGSPDPADARQPPPPPTETAGRQPSGSGVGLRRGRVVAL